MNCDDARVLMHGHLDGELDLAADLEVQRHIEECPRCVSEYAALRAMRTRLKDEEFRFEAPPALKEKIRRAIPSAVPSQSNGYQSQRRAWVPRVARFAVPLAIGAMLALIIAPRTIGPSLDQRLAGEVVASHVRSLMAAHMMDVASTDQHTVKPWFNGKLDFSPPVTDFAKDGFPLVGGRLDYIDGRPVAALGLSAGQTRHQRLHVADGRRIIECGESRDRAWVQCRAYDGRGDELLDRVGFESAGVRQVRGVDSRERVSAANFS